MKHSVIFIDGQRANVSYDARVDMMRGVFLNTHGEARFMASSVKELKIAARDALESYRHACERAGVEPFHRRRSIHSLAAPFERLKSLLH
ncbi:TPA: hypothetical protein ACITN2_004337 [Salmonella enterica subsp. enterica serovar Virchow]